MIGLVLVTHGRLAEEFIAAMEHVVGPQAGVRAICIGPDDDMDSQRQAIARAAREVDDGSGVILLTDMFGGTPSNMAISLMGRPNVEVIAGINLPMLIKLATVRKTKSVGDAVDAAQEAGRKYIAVASKMLANAS
jgi:mannose PTS system EIIA component